MGIRSFYPRWGVGAALAAALAGPRRDGDEARLVGSASPPSDPISGLSGGTTNPPTSADHDLHALRAAARPATRGRLARCALSTASSIQSLDRQRRARWRSPRLDPSQPYALIAKPTIKSAEELKGKTNHDRRAPNGITLTKILRRADAAKHWASKSSAFNALFRRRHLGPFSRLRRAAIDAPILIPPAIQLLCRGLRLQKSGLTIDYTHSWRFSPQW